MKDFFRPRCLSAFIKVFIEKLLARIILRLKNISKFISKWSCDLVFQYQSVIVLSIFLSFSKKKSGSKKMVGLGLLWL